MNSTLPFESINGDKLSTEQRYYLEGIFAGLRNRGVTFPGHRAKSRHRKSRPRPRQLDCGGTNQT